MKKPEFEEIRQCVLAPVGWQQKLAWVAVDEQGNALSVFAVLQISKDGPLRVKDAALYTTPSRRGEKLAKRLLIRARDDLAAKSPSVPLQWSGIATPDGYWLVQSFGFSIEPEESDRLGALLDEKLANNPDDERLRSYARLREEHGGQLPYEPLRPELADRDGLKTLHDAAEVLQLQVVEEG
ncbi:hypothetical protein [Nocardia sp. NBC_01388]|uniref:hypothetical protein n=1 Tax=Nocardia sp. NBC_01388 TaxID=2903596 RepID=UPI00325612EA